MKDWNFNEIRTEIQEELYKLEQDIKVWNTKRKWQQLCGMDNEKMGQLASYLAMEVYFRYGFGGISSKGKRFLVRQKGENWIEFLERQESLEDYIKVLSAILEGVDEETVRAAYQYLKENSEENPLSIVHKFIEPYIGGKYQVGKVYFADVVEESLSKIGAPWDGLVKLCDEETHYKFMGRILYNYHVFNNAEYHCYSNRILAEYFDYYGWIGNAEVEAYLLENIHKSKEGMIPYGYEYKTIPVRVVGFKEDGMPVVRFVQEWYY